MIPLILAAFVFYVWTEATAAPYLASPAAKFTFSTLEECRDLRDLFLLLTGPTERVSGCDEAT